MITFKSIAHFFAHAFQAIKKDEPKIAADLTKVEATAPVVETVTAAAGAGAAVPVEQAAYAALGALSAVLQAGDSAASAKLADAGLDTVAIQKVEALLKDFPALVAIAKTL